MQKTQHISQCVKEEYDYDLFGYKGIFCFLTWIRRTNRYFASCVTTLAELAIIEGS